LQLGSGSRKKIFVGCGFDEREKEWWEGGGGGGGGHCGDVMILHPVAGDVIIWILWIFIENSYSEPDKGDLLLCAKFLF